MGRFLLYDGPMIERQPPQGEDGISAEPEAIAELEQWTPSLKKNIERSMLDKRFDDTGARFEQMLLEGTLPRVIISEDGSSRFSASIIQLFLEKLAKHLPDRTNVPIVSYAVGRTTRPEDARTRAEDIRRMLAEKYPHGRALFVTDHVEFGGSIAPLLTALESELSRLDVMTGGTGHMGRTMRSTCSTRYREARQKTSPSGLPRRNTEHASRCLTSTGNTVRNTPKPCGGSRSARSLKMRCGRAVFRVSSFLKTCLVG